jgi:hypothetical protein
MVKVEQGLTAIARGAIPDELDFAERTAIRAPPTRRRRRSILAIGGATLALLGGAGFALHQRTRAAAPAVAALAATPVATPPGRGRVEVSFASNPPGAAVFSAGAREPLGVTPFSSSFPTSSQGQTFEFRLAGRRSERREVVLASDTRLSVALLAEPAPVITPPVASQRAQSRHRATRLDRTAVLDPFK